MAKLYKIREQDLDEELLKRLFSSGNTGIDLETVLNDYFKKTDKIGVENIDQDFIEELKAEVSDIQIDLSNYREKTVLIGMEDLTAELSGTIEDLQKQIDGITGASDLANIAEQLNKIKTDINDCKIAIETNKDLAKQYTDEKINIVIEDLGLAKEKLVFLESKINTEVRFKSEKIVEDDLEEDLLAKINAAYEAKDKKLNDLEYTGSPHKILTVDSENHITSSEILILGYFLKDESVVNTFLENKTIGLFFDVTNNIKYELMSREVEKTVVDPETEEKTASTTTEYYYEATKEFFNSDTNYRYRLLFDQYSKTLYYLGENQLHTLISSGMSESGGIEQDTVTKKITFKETSPSWKEEVTDSGDTFHSISFEKEIDDTIISDVYMLDGTQYRNSVVDIFVTDTTITIKSQDPFTGYFLLDSVTTEDADQLESIAKELDELNGEVV